MNTNSFTSKLSVVLILLWALCPITPVRDTYADVIQNLVRHEIEVKITPAEHTISAQDKITVPHNFSREFTFLIHKGLNPHSETQGVRIKKDRSGDRLADSYRITLPAALSTFVIKYGGAIDHPLEPIGKEQARGFDSTPGIISAQGIYLSGGSYWYPVFGDTFLSFSLRAEVPAGWEVVSQGKRTLNNKGSRETVIRWESPEPQEEIFIAGARFTEYARRSGRIDAMVFLRTPDKALADKYIDATLRYITMYEKLIGPYPYGKFALVENFWETGFGMPSFTLLGPKIIRFPFIITSSYPHEILHNWWGNSVFPYLNAGNWSEGITAYLADHLIKEQQGAGVEYRRTTLQKYADYVSGSKDFPVTEFHSRHSSSTEAVGYGKALMFFHMLRRDLGDKTFVLGLQDFYKNNKFRVAAFRNIRKSFETVSGKDLAGAFHQWIERTGAPQLMLSNAGAFREGKGFTLTVDLEQMQRGDAYVLRVPVAVTLEGHEKAYQADVSMEDKHLKLRLHLPSMPLRIDVDPEFDLFRRLDREEIPPAISQALGAKKMLILLPSSAPEKLLREYRGFAESLGNSGPDVAEIRLDREVKVLPADRAVAVLGWENRFADELISAVSGYDVSMDKKSLRIGKTVLAKADHSVVLTARNKKNRDMAIMLVAGPGEALPGLGRKLPHYHKYSYLGFEGGEPANILKGGWPINNSPMTAFIAYGKATAKVEMAALASRQPLIPLPASFSKERMIETIEFLSSAGLQGRGLGSGGLDRAAEFIAMKFSDAGLRPAGDGEKSYFQEWRETLNPGGDSARQITLKNVIGLIPGKKKDFSGQSIIVGAHYDHLGLGWPDVRGSNKGTIHPGADDNASGVSVLIELAAVLAGTDPDRSIVFVAFTGEEAGRIGSKHYVGHEENCPDRKCFAMLNLDTVGRLGKKKLLALGADSAKEWVHILRGAGFVTGVDVETVNERLDSSDQISFQDSGIPAIQLFSGPHPDYHRPADTPDKIDADGLVRIASVAKEIVEYLASRDEPLTLSTASGSSVEDMSGERKVSLGTIPDFGFKGGGYRLSGVEPGSAAEAAGLREGDIITRINSENVRGLKDLSDILKKLTPGSRISITFLRGEKDIRVETTVKGK